MFLIMSWLQVDELERLYSLHLHDARKIAVTSTAGGRGVLAHVALGSTYPAGEAACAEVAEALRSRLAASLSPQCEYAIPQKVVVYEQLPSSAAGKILYGSLNV